MTQTVLHCKWKAPIAKPGSNKSTALLVWSVYNWNTPLHPRRVLPYPLLIQQKQALQATSCHLC